MAFMTLNALKGASLADWKSIEKAKHVLAMDEKDHERLGVTLKEAPEGSRYLVFPDEAKAKQEELDIPDRVWLVLLHDEMKKKDRENKLSKDEVELAEKLLADQA